MGLLPRWLRALLLRAETRNFDDAAAALTVDGMLSFRQIRNVLRLFRSEAATLVRPYDFEALRSAPLLGRVGFIFAEEDIDLDYWARREMSARW